MKIEVFKLQLCRFSEKYDPMVMHLFCIVMEVVDLVSGSIDSYVPTKDGVCCVLAVKTPRPLKKRDFVTQRVWRDYDRELMIFNHSVNHTVHSDDIKKFRQLPKWLKYSNV